MNITKNLTLKEAKKIAIDNAIECDELALRLNDVYKERDMCVALIAGLAVAFTEFEVWIGKHPENDETWDREWMNIVYMELPTGQLSWHIHDSELEMFKFLEEGRLFKEYDGYTTEEKYDRIKEYLRWLT